MRQLAISCVAMALLATVAATGAQVQFPDPGLGGRGVGAGRASVPATGTGLLMGQVVDGVTGKPVTDATVALSGGGVRGAGNGQGPGQLSAPRVMVDGQGRFVFRDLPPGTFTLGASRVGYFGGGSGQRSPAGPSRPVELVDGERLGDVTLRLWQYGVISGTVLDETGAPVPGISARLVRRTAVNGRWQFVGAGSISTDDRGAYRFGTVTPGNYVVSVRSGGIPGEQLMLSLLMTDESSLMRVLPKLMDRGEESLLVDSNVHVYPPLFYPAAASASQATVLAMTPGAERSTVDFRVKSISARRVGGVVTGIPVDSSITLRLKPVDATAPDDGFTSSGATSQNPRFVMTGVAPGQYVLQAESRPNYSAQTGARGRGGPGAPLPAAPDAPTWCATLPVTVADGNISDLVISLHPGGRVLGRVEFDGSGERPTAEQLNQISVTVAPFEQTSFTNIPAGRVEADGTFRTASVAAGRYLLRITGVGLGRGGAPGPALAPGTGRGPVGPAGPAGATRPWRPRAAMAGLKDALDQPLEIDAADIDNVVITFTDQPLTTLSGAVRDAKGAGDPDAVILVFPTDSRLWTDLGSSARRVRTARTTRAGAYAIPGLPAGEYFAVAGTDEMLVDWQAPNALQALSARAARVVIAEGSSQTLDLKGGGR